MKQNVPVLVVGDSGTGKSTAVGSLPPERTYIINTENKVLPIANAQDFKNTVIESFKMLDRVLEALLSDAGTEAYDYVVLDSFTSMTEIINRYCEYAFQGFEQWKQYNALIVNVIIKLKRLKQQVFVIAIPEQKEVNFNENRAYARVKGKELKYGHLEKEFAIVLFTKEVYDDETGRVVDIEMVYWSNKFNTAKSPNGMFTGVINNSFKTVADNISKFYDKDK